MKGFLSLVHVSSNKVLNVLSCSLKVVMFGDNVPKERADDAKEAARNCDALLVVGSAVMTMSAFRLARYQ